METSAVRVATGPCSPWMPRTHQLMLGFGGKTDRMGLNPKPVFAVEPSAGGGRLAHCRLENVQPPQHVPKYRRKT